MRYIKPLTLFLIILLLYHVAVGLIWQQIGYNWNFSHGHIFGWLTFGISEILFPALFVAIAYRFKPAIQTRSWTVGAWLICWVPLMISTVVSNIVFNDVTGYYRDYVLSHISGWGETRTAEHAIVLIQWIWVTVFTWILMPNWRRDANK